MTDTAKRSISSEVRHDRPTKPSAATRTCEPPGLSRPVAIGDLAREFAISTRAIRFYESRGLLCPARRGTVRIFGPEDRRRLALIIRAKNLGLTLEDIAEHLAIYDTTTTTLEELAQLKERADRHIATLIGKRNDLQATLKELREIRAGLMERTLRARSS
ncbi:MAG: MerR family transcriptional regulator [Hyphomicrobiaceae bacterium]